MLSSNFIVTESLKVKKRKLKDPGSKSKGLLLQIIISLVPVFRIIVIIGFYIIAFCSDKTFKENYGTIEEEN
jgi:hypothetical protein